MGLHQSFSQGPRGWRLSVAATLLSCCDRVHVTKVYRWIQWQSCLPGLNCSLA